MSTGAEDCLAMEESGEWIAFRKDAHTEESVLAFAADEGYDAGRVMQVTSAFMRPCVEGVDDFPSGEDWHTVCEADHPNAIPVWWVE